MKTAEEWVEIQKQSSNTPITAKEYDEAWANLFKQIQLDAWKQGMSDAASIVLQVAGLISEEYTAIEEATTKGRYLERIKQ